MKRSMVAVAAVSLSLTAAACDGMPEDAPDPTTTESGALSSPVTNPGFKQPLPTSVTIDFDNSPGGAVAAGSMIDSTYASLGVTFSCVSCVNGMSGHAYALPAAVGNNAVSLFAPPSVPAFDARYGAVRATFATPRRWVSIAATAVLPPEWLTTPTKKPWLEAFDANNNLIGSVQYYPFNYGDVGWGTAQTLTVTSTAANIAYVQFSSQAPGSGTPVYGQFDNLRFNSDYYRLPL
jgi:hypothetical protein